LGSLFDAIQAIEELVANEGKVDRPIDVDQVPGFSREQPIIL
jgi:hypothetical protein